jgi:hypothetical protein
VAMLDRYHKTGGFLQLLNLIETCGPQKQAKFLEMIKAEDPVWAEAIEKKMLSVKKIVSWPDEALAEVIGILQELTVATAMHGLEQEARDKLLRTMNNAQKRKIEELFQANHPSQAEISTMFMKIIIEVRKMLVEGKLRIEKYAPELQIERDIEDQLKRTTKAGGTAGANADASPDGPNAMPAGGLNFELADTLLSTGSHAEGAHKEEIVQLKRKIISLAQENNQLKTEVSRLRLKLDQVRKAAA